MRREDLSIICERRLLHRTGEARKRTGPSREVTRQRGTNPRVSTTRWQMGGDRLSSCPMNVRGREDVASDSFLGEELS